MINPNSYSPNENGPINNDTGKFEKTTSSTFLAKVFLYFAVELLLTGFLTIGFSYLFDHFFPMGLNDGSGLVFYCVVMAISAIGLMISIIFVQKSTLIKQKGGYVATLFYVLFISLVLSCIGYFIASPVIVGTAVCICSVLFLIMCLFGILLKKSYAWLVGLLVGLGIAGLLMYVVNSFLLPFAFISSTVLDAYISTMYITEWIMLIYSCIITIFDVIKIKKAAKNGTSSDPIALYYSLALYQDYIVILFYLIYILLLNRSRNS